MDRVSGEDASTFAQMAFLHRVRALGSSCNSNSPRLYLTRLRFALADAEKLHRKISEMGQRIRQLEEALEILQSAVSTQTHPLLRDELLAVKFGPEVRKPCEQRHPSRDALAKSMEALGTLTIGDSGESTYFGNSAGSEVCHSFI